MASSLSLNAAIAVESADGATGVIRGFRPGSPQAFETAWLLAGQGQRLIG
jgi:hypothetical protein